MLKIAKQKILSLQKPSVLARKHVVPYINGTKTGDVLLASESVSETKKKSGRAKSWA